MPIRLTDAEINAFVARGHKVTMGKPVGDKLAEIATKITKPKGSVNRNAMQQRRDDDPYKSQAERDYAAVLEAEQAAGQIKRWAYEPMGLRIDDGTGGSHVFWPDFGVWNSVWVLEFREIKGKGKKALTPQAKTKFIAARRLFPEHTFRMLQAPNWEEIL